MSRNENFRIVIFSLITSCGELRCAKPLGPKAEKMGEEIKGEQK